LKVLLIAYDNGSHISEFPLALGYLGAALEKAGHQVTIYNADIYHYSAKHLTNYLDKNNFELVGLSSISGYWQWKKVKEISQAVNKSKMRNYFLYVLGGHMFTPEPEYFLKLTGADVVCLGEGEETIVDLCNDNKHDLMTEIDDIAFLNNNKLVKTKERKTVKDLDKISFPAWHLFPMEHYTLAPYPNSKHTDRTFPVLASRGCSFHCNFCYRMIPGIRFRSPENIVAEIKELKDKYHITYIAFYDELLMASPKRTTEICNAIIEADLDIKWCCDGRLNFAKHEVLQLMKKAGCTFINYGIESYDNEVLKNMNKQLTISQIDVGLANTINEGISPGINIIFGNYGDTEVTLLKGVKLILQYTDYSQLRTVRPVCPYPGSQLYYDAIRDGKLKDIKDFYENKHINSDLITVNFTNMSDKEFYDLLYYYNKRLIIDYLNKQTKSYENIMKKVYFDQDASFRGFRQT